MGSKEIGIPPEQEPDGQVVGLTITQRPDGKLSIIQIPNGKVIYNQLDREIVQTSYATNANTHIQQWLGSDRKDPLTVTTRSGNIAVLPYYVEGETPYFYFIMKTYTRDGQPPTYALDIPGGASHQWGDHISRLDYWHTMLREIYCEEVVLCSKEGLHFPRFAQRLTNFQEILENYQQATNANLELNSVIRALFERLALEGPAYLMHYDLSNPACYLSMMDLFGLPPILQSELSTITDPALMQTASIFQGVFIPHNQGFDMLNFQQVPPPHFALPFDLETVEENGHPKALDRGYVALTPKQLSLYFKGVTFQANFIHHTGLGQIGISSISHPPKPLLIGFGKLASKLQK